MPYYEFLIHLSNNKDSIVGKKRLPGFAGEVIETELGEKYISSVEGGYHNRRVIWSRV